MTLISPAVAVDLVCSVTRLPPIAAAEWIRARAELGKLGARARSEDWVRPTLVEDGEIQGFRDYLEICNGYELLAYIHLAIDMAQDDIPLMWAPVISVDVDIDPRFWSSRDAKDPLWDNGIFLGGHQDLPQFSYRLIGIEFDRENLENLLAPFKPRPVPVGFDQGAVCAVASNPAASRRLRPRAGKFDVEAFVRKALEMLKEEGGIGPAFTRAKLHEALELWCGESWGDTPSRSWMYSHFAEAEQRYRDYLSSLV